MTQKTHFSFELRYALDTPTPLEQRDEVMASAGPALQALFTAQDGAASVALSDSHKGNNHKILEIVSTLDDAQIASILKAFTGQHGLSLQALE